MKERAEARRLTTIPGVGAIVASALVAAVGQAESFERGRDLAAWLGLVPRQFTTGGKPKLLGISKRGNKYLRRQLIHGARAALPYVAERDAAWPMGRGLASRAHRNVAIVAFANKLACCGAENGSPSQECPWRHRTRPVALKASNGQQGVCERVTTGWPDSRTTLRKPGFQKTARSDAGSFMRTGARESPSWPEEAPRGRIR